jgi:multisubunit Na+/H+ antiporter MnhE subunit
MHANAITMTPGTIVIGVNNNRMLVHFFDKDDYSEVPNEKISQIIDKK